MCVCVCQDIVSTLNCANSRLFVGFVVVGCFLSVRSFFLSLSFKFRIQCPVVVQLLLGFVKQRNFDIFGSNHTN